MAPAGAQCPVHPHQRQLQKDRQGARHRPSTRKGWDGTRVQSSFRRCAQGRCQMLPVVSCGEGESYSLSTDVWGVRDAFTRFLSLCAKVNRKFTWTSQPLQEVR